MIKKYINKDNNIIKYTFLILGMLGISQLFSITYLNLFFSVILGVFFVLSSYTNVVMLLFITLPFFNLFNASIGNTSLYYIYILIFIYKYLKDKNYKISKKKVLLLLLLTLLRVPSFDFELLIKWFLWIIVLILLYDDEIFCKNIVTIIKYMMNSFIFSSIIGFFMMRSGAYLYKASYVYTARIGMTIRFAGLIGDSVFYCQFASILIACQLVISYYNEKNLFRFITIAIVIYFIIISYSKTGLLIASGLIFLYFVMMIIKNSKSRKTVFKSLFLIVLFSIAFIVIINYILNNTSNVTIQNYINRFTKEDLTTGRIDIAKHYIELIKENFSNIFFAMKQSVYNDPFKPGNDFDVIIRHSHNIYIETICAFGIFFSICIFIVFIKNIFREIFIKKQIITLFPMFVILLTGFTIHGHFEWHYYFVLNLALVFMNDKIVEYLKDD